MLVPISLLLKGMSYLKFKHRRRTRAKVLFFKSRLEERASVTVKYRKFEKIFMVSNPSKSVCYSVLRTF
jgi:hypothetical protein